MLAFIGFTLLIVKDRVQEITIQKEEDREHRRKQLQQMKVAFQKKIESSKKLKSVAELSALKKFDEAIQQAQEVIAEYPESAEAYMWWGIALVKTDRKEEGVAKFVKSGELDPYNPRNLVYWGLTLTMLGELEKAVGKYESAIRLDPLNSNAFSYLGKTLSRLGRVDEAIDKLEEAVALNKFNADAYEPLVRELYQTREYERAWQFVTRARNAKVEIPDPLLQLLTEEMPEPG